MNKMKFPTWLCLALSIVFAGNVSASDVFSSKEAFTPEQTARLATFLNKELYIYDTKLVGSAAEFKKHLSAHLSYQVKLQSEGIMFGAGPTFFENHKGHPDAGMIIIRANSFEEAKAIADADPMHSSGTRTYTLRKWILNEGTINLSINFSDQKVKIQ